jgi:hypothetical protein
MIQRIQTVWLLLASIAIFASLKIPFYAGNISTTAVDGTIVKTWTELNGMSNMIANILTISTGVIALISIFLFNNRKLQLRFVVVSIFLEIILMFNYESNIKKFVEGQYSIGAFLPLLAVLLFFLAARGIRKDNKIIAESNRLR